MNCVECNRPMCGRGERVTNGLMAPGSRGYCSSCYARLLIAGERYKMRGLEEPHPVVDEATDATVRAWVSAKFPGEKQLLDIMGLA